MTRTSSFCPPLAMRLTLPSACAPTAVIRLESTSMRNVAWRGPLVCGCGTLSQALSLVIVAKTHFFAGVERVSW